MSTGLIVRCVMASLLALGLIGVGGAAARPSGCLSRSAARPWGIYPLRVWTPKKSSTDYSWMESGGRRGILNAPPFRARLVQAYGVDRDSAHRVVEVDTEGGCRRLYRADSFSVADNAFVDAEMARHPLPKDPATYALDVQPGRADPAALEKGTLGKYETQHFAFWYGTNRKGQSYSFVAEQGLDWDQYLRRAGDWAERVWALDRSVLNAPMPYGDRPASERRKINIYVRGTGSPFADGDDLEHIRATGSDAIWISALNLNFGSYALVHEFGHVIQFYSGGFRDRPSAGPIWETGASWNTTTLDPDSPSILPDYSYNLDKGPFASQARYGAFPFMAFLYERDRTRPLVWNAWTDNVRTTDGVATEDFVPTIIRLGQAAGIYPKGMRSFADDMGWYGARLVTSDFANQRAMLDATAAVNGMARGLIWSSLTAGSGPNSFTSRTDRPLHQFGTDLIPLKVTRADRKVSVSLTGEVKADVAAWRFVLVAVRGETDASYSALGSVEGSGSATISRKVPEGADLYLAVTATPYRYETVEWDESKPVAGPRFPYRVTIHGATTR